MAKRIQLRDRVLPTYSRGEEQMNMITHIVGGGVGVLVLALCLLKSTDTWSMASGLVYSISLIAMFAISSIYHGLRPSMAKKVMQIIDHCAIYFLIAGTYTVILLSAFRPVYEQLAWGLFILQWTLVAIAVTLTAIDLKKYNAFSMICYIGMGWSVLPFWRQAQQVLQKEGFLLLLAGGIVHSIGAVLYGIGSKCKWMHSVFHIFVVIGSILQAMAILIFGL